MQGSLKKWHFLISQDLNFQAPCATDPKLVLWLANTLSCDTSEPKLQRGEVLNRYEKLYFPPRPKRRKICDPASSSHRI